MRLETHCPGHPTKVMKQCFNFFFYISLSAEKELVSALVQNIESFIFFKKITISYLWNTIY